MVQNKTYGKQEDDRGQVDDTAPFPTKGDDQMHQKNEELIC